MAVNNNIRNARRLQDRGLFLDAGRIFNENLTQPDGNIDLLLGVETASLKLVQGLVGDCEDLLGKMESPMDRNSLEAGPLAVFDMLRATSTVATTVKLEQPLRSSVDIYNRLLLNQPEAAYDRFMIMVASSYHCLLTLARYLGYQPAFDTPSFSVEFQSNLSSRLLSTGRYEDAIKIATLSNFSDESFDNTNLLARLLEEESLPKLLRAETLWYYGDKLRQTTGEDAWQEKLNEAVALYNAEGHATAAFQIRVDILKHRRQENTMMADTDELWHIKEKLERAGNWRGAMGCLSAIITINTNQLVTPSYALRTQVQQEWVRLLEICRSGQERVSASMIEALDWQSTVCNTARDLEYLENYYQGICDFDAPSIILYVVQKLRREYTRIGETDLAASILTRCPDVLPRRLIIQEGLDAFQIVLKEATTAGTLTDTEQELASLRNELEKVRVILDETTDVEGKEAEVRRLLEIASTYIRQWPSRGEAQMDVIAGCIFPAIHEACDTLDARRSLQWKGETQLRLADLVLQSLRDGPSIDELPLIFNYALDSQERAIAMFEESGHKLDMGMAKALKASTFKILWQVLGFPPENDAFTSAVSNLEDAFKLMGRYGNLDRQRAFCHSIARLWYKKLQILVEENVRDLESTETYSSIVKWIDEADRLASVERNNVSALARGRAVLGKQSLQADKTLQEVQAMAIDIYSRTKDDIGIWTWIQKFKARSLSDMLALGINIPLDLRRLIEADEELTRMLDEEEQLTLQCNSARLTSLPDEAWHSRNKLEAHRDKMRARPLLRQVLDLREGQPMSLPGLQDISKRDERTKTKRSVFFVDWCVVGDRWTALVVSDSGLSKIDIDTDIDISEWRKNWDAALIRVKSKSDNHGSDNPGKAGAVDETHHSDEAKHIDQANGSNEPEHAEVCDEAKEQSDEVKKQPAKPSCQDCLAQLSHLVQKIVHLTHKGDLLIFCPNDTLRGIPLHAAAITCPQDNTQRSLIERNPVVYTASMTSLAHCVSKEAAKCRSPVAPFSRSYVSVYERTSENQPLVFQDQIQRSLIYNAVRSVSSNRQPCGVFIGGEATPARLVTALQADCMHFIGHCDLSLDGKPRTVLQQGIQIASEKGSVEQPETQLFTTSDFFTVDMGASSVLLLACASAVEASAAPGEPLGLISALLCAGATSVVGTLWEIQLRTADAIMRCMDGLLGGEGDDVVDLAVAVQKAVVKLKYGDDTGSAYHWASLVLCGSWFMSRGDRREKG